VRDVGHPLLDHRLHIIILLLIICNDIEMATYLNIEIYTKRVLHGTVADMMEGRGGRTRGADKAIDLAGVQVAGLNEGVFGGSRRRLEEWAWTKFSSCGTIVSVSTARTGSDDSKPGTSTRPESSVCP
jgi:hypothetical protein